MTDVVAGMISLLLPKTKTIIYSGLSDANFNFNPRLYYEYATQNENLLEIKFKHQFVLRGSSEKNFANRYPNINFLDPNKFSHAIKIWRASYWITASRPIYFFPLGLLRVKYINAWHGIPLKSIGLNVENATLFSKIRFKYYGVMCHKIVSPSIYFSKIFQEAYGVSTRKILISGSPVVEFLSNPHLVKIESLNLDTDYLNILYAPTYRDSKNETGYIKFSAKLKKAIEKKCGRKVRFYYRPHPLMKNKSNGEAILITNSQIEEISYNYNQFDLVISDYSSTGLDAAISGINVLLYWGDYDTYIQHRGFGVDTDMLSYCNVARNQDALPLEIYTAINKSFQNLLAEPYHITSRDTCKLFFEYINRNVIA